MLAGVQLPPRVWLEIALHLNGKDLKNLALTNSTIHRACLPLLFHMLTINIAEWSPDVCCVMRDIEDDGITRNFNHFRSLVIKNAEADVPHHQFPQFLETGFDRLMQKLVGVRIIRLDLNAQKVLDDFLSPFLDAISAQNHRVAIYADIRKFNVVSPHLYTLHRMYGLTELKISGNLTSTGEDEFFLQRELAAIICNSPKMQRLTLTDSFLKFDDVLTHVDPAKMPALKSLTLTEVLPPFMGENIDKLYELRRLVIAMRGGARHEEFSDTWVTMKDIGPIIPHIATDMVSATFLSYLSIETSTAHFVSLELRLPRSISNFCADEKSVRDLAKNFWHDTLPVLLSNNLETLSISFDHDVLKTYECPWNPKHDPARRWGIEYMSKHIHLYRPTSLKYIKLICPAVKEWTATAMRTLAVLASRNKANMTAELDILFNDVDYFPEDTENIWVDVSKWMEIELATGSSRKYAFWLKWRCMCYCASWEDLGIFRKRDKRRLVMHDQVFVTSEKAPKALVEKDEEEEE